MLAERDRRALLAAVVVIPALFVIRVVPPRVAQWTALTEGQASLTEKRVDQLRRLAADAPSMRLALDSARAVVDEFERPRSQSRGSGGALATLAAALADHARETSVLVSSIAVLPRGTSRGPYQEVRVRIHATTDTPGLEAFLRRIERDPLGFRVDALSVVQPEPLAGNTVPEALRLELTVAHLDRVAVPAATRTYELAARVHSRPTPDTARVRLARNPFRTSGAVSLVRFGQPPLSSLPINERPAYVIRAIVGGPPWSAMIGGIPGQAGTRFVSAGDSVESFVITTITASQVTFRGSDSTWTLALLGSERPEG